MVMQPVMVMPVITSGGFHFMSGVLLSLKIDWIADDASLASKSWCRQNKYQYKRKTWVSIRRIFSRTYRYWGN
ncbi:hypothetical protein ES705_24280 [subsurface metagenome]